MKKVIAILMIVSAITLAGCARQAEKVSYNISKQADYFNIQRRVTVINARTDRPVLEIIGLISVQQSDGDLDIIVEVAPGKYKKHFVGLGDGMIYVVEDIDGAYVDKHHFEINFQPEMIIPIAALKVIDVD
ncbi:hypothetical protein ACH6CV_16780 [Bacillota bacterium Meth-B3]